VGFAYLSAQWARGEIPGLLDHLGRLCHNLPGDEADRGEEES
jgi:hypothetical protein